MSKTLGKIIQIVGVVVDVEFPRDVKLPAIYDALHVKKRWFGSSAAPGRAHRADDRAVVD